MEITCHIFNPVLPSVVWFLLRFVLTPTTLNRQFFKHRIRLATGWRSLSFARHSTAIWRKMSFIYSRRVNACRCSFNTPLSLLKGRKFLWCLLLIKNDFASIRLTGLELIPKGPQQDHAILFRPMNRLPMKFRLDVVRWRANPGAEDSGERLSRRHWSALSRYFDDESIANDNNDCEQLTSGELDNDCGVGNTQ